MCPAVGVDEQCRHCLRRRQRLHRTRHDGGEHVECPRHAGERARDHAAYRVVIRAERDLGPRSGRSRFVLDMAGLVVVPSAVWMNGRTMDVLARFRASARMYMQPRRRQRNRQQRCRHEQSEQLSHCAKESMAGTAHGSNAGDFPHQAIVPGESCRWWSTARLVFAPPHAWNAAPRAGWQRAGVQRIEPSARTIDTATQRARCPPPAASRRLRAPVAGPRQ